MIRRRKSNLPKWRYEFDCRKCDNIREVHDPRKGRDGVCTARGTLYATRGIRVSKERLDNCPLRIITGGRE